MDEAQLTSTTYRGNGWLLCVNAQNTSVRIVQHEPRVERHRAVRDASEVASAAVDAARQQNRRRRSTAARRAVKVTVWWLAAALFLPPLLLPLGYWRINVALMIALAVGLFGVLYKLREVLDAITHQELPAIPAGIFISPIVFEHLTADQLEAITAAQSPELRAQVIELIEEQIAGTAQASSEQRAQAIRTEAAELIRSAAEGIARPKPSASSKESSPDG